MDTAPTGHTLLLLDATGAYHREVARRMSATAHFTTPMAAHLNWVAVNAGDFVSESVSRSGNADATRHRSRVKTRPARIVGD